MQRFTFGLAAALSIAMSCGGSNDGGPGKADTGGATTGGASGSGGSTGAATGGSTTGGSASGGTATGGSVTGGGNTGGSTTGGAPGGASPGAAGGSGGKGGNPTAGGGQGPGGAGRGGSSSGADFRLTSPDHAEGAKFDGKFTCNGGNLGAGVNPELDWSGAPDGTKSFAITFIDTTIGGDKPMGQHWAIWNIPATITMFPQGTKTLAGELANAKQSGAFLTPCAQSLVNGADDQYEFTIFALPTDTLTVSGTSVANARTALMSAKPLATATLHGHAGLKGK